MIRDIAIEWDYKALVICWLNIEEHPGSVYPRFEKKDWLRRELRSLVKWIRISIWRPICSRESGPIYKTWHLPPQSSSCSRNTRHEETGAGDFLQRPAQPSASPRDLWLVSPSHRRLLIGRLDSGVWHKCEYWGEDSQAGWPDVRRHTRLVVTSNILQHQPRATGSVGQRGCVASVASSKHAAWRSRRHFAGLLASCSVVCWTWIRACVQ